MFQRHIEHRVQATEIIEGARCYAGSNEWSDESRIVDLRGWLFDQRWTDEHVSRLAAGRLSAASNAMAVDLGTFSGNETNAMRAMFTGAGWLTGIGQPGWKDTPL